MIYTHVLNRGGRGVRSPLDGLDGGGPGAVTGIARAVGPPRTGRVASRPPEQMAREADGADMGRGPPGVCGRQDCRAGWVAQDNNKLGPGRREP